MHTTSNSYSFLLAILESDCVEGCVGYHVFFLQYLVAVSRRNFTQIDAVTEEAQMFVVRRNNEQQTGNNALRRTECSLLFTDVRSRAEK